MEPSETYPGHYMTEEQAIKNTEFAILPQQWGPGDRVIGRTERVDDYIVDVFVQDGDEHFVVRWDMSPGHGLMMSIGRVEP